VNLGIALVVATLCGSSASASESEWLSQRQSHSELGDSVRGSFRPAFRAVESISDGVYDVMRLRLARLLLPRALSSDLSGLPREESFGRFSRNLSRRQERYMDRARQSYPNQQVDGRYDERRMAQWRRWVIEQQQTVVFNALEQTLLERYALERFAQDSESYVTHPSRWDPSFLMTAGIVGGALVYTHGLNADATIADWRVAVNLRAGDAFRRAIQSGDVTHGLASVELGPRGSPWSASVDWGADHGRLIAERVGVDYRLRF
jgi:hypothetical protein